MMTRQSDNTVEVSKEHLEFLRRGRDDVAGDIASSREAIERSYALLRLIDKIEAELKTEGTSYYPPSEDG